MNYLKRAEEHRDCMFELFQKEYNPTLLGAIQKDQEEIMLSLVDKGLGVDTIIEAGMKLEYLRLQEKRIENEEK